MKKIKLKIKKPTPIASGREYAVPPDLPPNGGIS